MSPSRQTGVSSSCVGPRGREEEEEEVEVLLTHRKNPTPSFVRRSVFDY
jgi:hypothetical protein